jgi:hypothetical protein
MCHVQHFFPQVLWCWTYLNRKRWTRLNCHATRTCYLTPYVTVAYHEQLLWILQFKSGHFVKYHFITNTNWNKLSDNFKWKLSIPHFGEIRSLISEMKHEDRQAHLCSVLHTECHAICDYLTLQLLTISAFIRHVWKVYINPFHVTHEISRAEALVLPVYIYLMFEISERNMARHLWTVRANYPCFNNSITRVPGNTLSRRWLAPLNRKLGEIFFWHCFNYFQFIEGSATFVTGEMSLNTPIGTGSSQLKYADWSAVVCPLSYLHT